MGKALEYPRAPVGIRKKVLCEPIKMQWLGLSTMGSHLVSGHRVSWLVEVAGIEGAYEEDALTRLLERVRSTEVQARLLALKRYLPELTAKVA